MKLCLAWFSVLVAGAAARSIEQCSETSSLRQLHVVYRHGDRTPTSLYPNDPNSPSDFPEGLGHITHKGKNDQYNLGRYLRVKYEDFLSYDPNEVGERLSSEEKHVCVFMQSVSCGTATTVYRTQDNINILLQECDNCLAIGVVDTDRDVDETGRGRRERRRRRRGNYSKILQIYRKSDRIFCPHGREEPRLKYHMQLSLLLNLLHARRNQRSRGLKIPDWALPLWGNMTKVAKYTTILNYKSPEYNKFRAGLLIRDIVRHADDVVSGNSNVKLYMYAAHDVAIAALTSAFGVFNQLAVPSSTAVITELHEDANGNFFIQMLFKNDTTRKPYRLEIPGCEGFRCSLATFKELARPYIPEDWRKECGLEPIPGGVDLFP
ncbi:unnamed protein product [Ixodes hexagonus]